MMEIQWLVNISDSGDILYVGSVIMVSVFKPGFDTSLEPPKHARYWLLLISLQAHFIITVANNPEHELRTLPRK